MGAVYNFTTHKNDNLDYILKCKEYENYIIEHKANVLMAYTTLFEKEDWTDKLPEEISIDDWNDALDGIRPEIEAHDDSKYSDEEFEPYRRRFNKTVQEDLYDKEHPESKEFVEEEFERAWTHHYLVNPHHPDFWNHTDIKDGALVPLKDPREDGPRDMDLRSIIHMICDWSGMSLKFRNKYSPVSWYNTQAADERKAMSTKTRHTLYLILTMMFPDEEVIE